MSDTHGRSPEQRRFQSPSGREWSAYLLELPPGLVASGRREVLRFEADSVALDLADWPADWHSLDDSALVALVRRATTPNYLPRDPR